MPDIMWMAIGFLGQGLFFSRLLWQWICSERAGHPVMPMGFIYLSVFGGGILLTYAIHLRDPVYMLGQSVGVMIYVRQWVLILRRDTVAPEGVACPHCGRLVPGTAPEHVDSLARPEDSQQ